MVRLGAVWPALVRQGSFGSLFFTKIVWSGGDGLGKAWLGEVRFGSVRSGTARQGSFGSFIFSMACPGRAWHGVARWGKAGTGEARLGAAWRGQVGLGAARQGCLGTLING